MTKLTDEQSRMLGALAEETSTAKIKVRDARAELVRKAHEDADKMARELRVTSDIMAFRLSETGVPTARIAKDGYATTSWKTADDAIKRGERYAPTVDGFLPEVEREEEPSAHQFETLPGGVLAFTFDGDTARVVQSGEHFDPADDMEWGVAANIFFGEDGQYRAAARAYLEETQ